MPVISGSGGGGVGGGSNNLCDVSPSDQIGTLDNILNRLQAVEAALSALLGTNVEALQLSDISNDLGWIYNVTYLGEEGWTQTPSGTLIPPTGWSGLSSVIDGLSGLTWGGAGWNVMTRYTSHYTDIAAGNSYFLHPDTNSSAYISAGDTLLEEASVGGGSYTGWCVKGDAVHSYIILAEGEIVAGTSAPTSGYVTMRTSVMKKASSTLVYYGSNTGNYPPSAVGGDQSTQLQAFAAMQINVVTLVNPGGFVFRFFNHTDGDIQIANLRVTFIRVA